MEYNNDNLHTIYILDDDELDIDELTFALSSYKKFKLIGSSKHTHTGRKAILQLKPDLLFLDINLGAISGLEILEELKEVVNWNMQIVFFSAHTKNLIHALRESVFDFLHKPIDTKELELILTRYEQNKKQNSLPSFNELLSKLIPGNDILLITHNGIKKAVRVNDIGYFEYNSQEKQWEAYLVNQDFLSIKKNTSANNILASSRYFIKTHQSFIININYLESIQGNACYLLPPFDEKVKIPVAKSEKRNLEDRFFNL